MAERIYFAIPSYRNAYETLDALLESNYLTYKNTENQNELLGLISQLQPDYLIIEKNLPGNKKFHDFIEELEELDIKILLWNDNIDEIIKVINGEIDIPSDQFEYFDDEISAAPINEQIDDNINSSAETTKWEKTFLTINNDEEIKNKVIAVTSFSGGNGKTEISINLGAWLNKNNFKVALLGYNLQNDDLAERLGIERRHSKGLLAAHNLYSNQSLSYQSLLTVIDVYQKDFDVLVGTEYPEDSEMMSEDFFVEIIKVLKSHYDFIIVDTESNNYSIAWLPVLKQVDHILIPCTTHISDLYHLIRGIKNLKDSYDIPFSKLDIVHNKAGEGGYIDESIISKNTGIECLAVIPYNKKILKSAESETPAVLNLKSRKLKKEMDQLLFRYTNNVNKDVKNPIYRFLRKKGVNN